MKKIVLALIAILVAVYIALSFLGSDKEYGAERLFYRANRKHNKIRLNPEPTPPAMLASVESDLEKIIKVYPETEIAKSAYIVLAETYISNEKYDEAIQILDTFVSGHDKEILLLSRAYFLNGVAYERLNKWDKALERFVILKDKYVNTPLGLQAPFYIAGHYAKKGMDADAEREFINAASFYEGLKKEHKGTLLGYASSGLLVQVYMNLKKYGEAGRVVEDTIIDYPMAITFMQQLPFVELIFLETLKRPDKAIEIYKYIIEKTEDLKLKKFLQDKIKELEGI